MKFNLPWCGHSKYWLCFKSDKESLLKKLQDRLDIELYASSKTCIVFHVEDSWIELWRKAYEIALDIGTEDLRALVVADEDQELDLDEVLPSFERIKVIQTIAENAWLGEDLCADKFTCFLQEIQDRKGNIFGYESFVRAEKDGELVGGWEIIQAAHDLKVHHILDKYLQSLAIKQFAASKLSGVLFVNFIAGFIQLPERYLSSLNQAVEDSDFIPKKVVLDVPIPDMMEDNEQLAQLIEFCNHKGYSAALDDVKSDADLDFVLSKSTPDYIKIDRGLTSNYANEVIALKIKSIIRRARKKGCMIIAEGVEDEETFNAMHKLGADLFQGYYFAKPCSIEDVKKSQSKSKKRSA